MSYSVCTCIINKSLQCLHGHVNVPNVVYRAALRAVELGRFATKTTKDEIKERAYACFNRMESYVKEFITNKVRTNSKLKVEQIGEEYVDTMLQYGMEFFDGNIPLSLICLLLDICGLHDEKKVKFCSLALSHSLSPVASVVCEDSIKSLPVSKNLILFCCAAFFTLQYRFTGQYFGFYFLVCSFVEWCLTW